MCTEEPLSFLGRSAGEWAGQRGRPELEVERNGFGSSSATGQPGGLGWTACFSLCDSIFSSAKPV